VTASERNLYLERQVILRLHKKKEILSLSKRKNHHCDEKERRNDGLKPRRQERRLVHEKCVPGWEYTGEGNIGRRVGWERMSVTPKKKDLFYREKPYARQRRKKTVR